jgi:hypothetical protein
MSKRGKSARLYLPEHNACPRNRDFDFELLPGGELLRDLNNANVGLDLGEGGGGLFFDSDSKSPINPPNNTFGV